MSDTANVSRPPSDGRFSHVMSQIRFRLRRLDRRRLGAIALAVAAALMTRSALTRASAIEAGLGIRVPVVVATEPLVAGSIVGEGQTEVELWPAAMVPEGAFRNINPDAEMVVNSNILEGEPITQARVSSGNLGLRLNEVAVTLPQPLAKPPLEVGYQVELVGVVGNSTDFLANATILTTGRIVAFSDDAVTVAVRSETMTRLIEHNAVGTVEVVVTPQRG